MIISIYILLIIYTNTMGLIIINKCKPFIDRELESKGYIRKELDNNEELSKFIKDSLLFLIPGYYLKKAIDLTSEDIDIDRMITEKEKKGELVKMGSSVVEDNQKVNTIFSKNISLSLGKYEKPSVYKVLDNEESMYTDMRYPNSDEVDMDFWEEEEIKANSYVEPVEPENNVVSIRREPVQEYLDSISEEEIDAMFKQLEIIRKLKKDSENFINGKAA